MEMKREYLLLKQHTDSELTFFLRKNAEEGWWLNANKGNAFIFIKRRMPGYGVCCRTITARDLGEGADERVRIEKEDLRDKGWEVFLVGEEENLRDSGRHTFLYSESNDTPEPAVDEKVEKKAKRSALFRAMGNALISLLYLALTLYLLTIYESFSFLFLMGCGALVLSSALALLSFLSLVAVRARGRNEKRYMEKGYYRLIDYTTRLSTLVLIYTLVLLVFDSAFRGF